MLPELAAHKAKQVVGHTTDWLVSQQKKENKNYQ